MTQQTFLLYDIESTGLNRCFDQVVQFAAIRTDTALNPLERHEFQVRLSPDIIPTPEAIIVHRIPPVYSKDHLSELDAMLEIHRQLNQPGTLSCGYNTLGFDDELLRFSFYRHLLPPYTHQYANQCQRLDIYPMIVFYLLYHPEQLQWPRIDGTISLKLEDMAQSNGFNSRAQHFHNAMTDVEATLALAQKLYKKPEMWHYLLGYFNKTTDSNRINQLPYCEKTKRRWGFIYSTQNRKTIALSMPCATAGKTPTL